MKLFLGKMRFFVFSFLIGIAVPNHAVDVIMNSGMKLTMLCPSTVQYWTLQRGSTESVLSSSWRTSNTFICDGFFKPPREVFANCLDGIVFDKMEGSPIVIKDVSSSFAGRYVCYYKQSDSIQHTETWNVTVIKTQPELAYSFNGMPQFTESIVQPQLSNGTLISISCRVIVYGFYHPGVILVHRDRRGTEQVLKTVAETRFESFEYEKEINLSAEIMVTETDSVFEVVCSVVGTSPTSKSSATFKGPVTEKATSSISLSVGTTVGVVIGVIAFIALIIAFCIVYAKYRRATHKHCGCDYPRALAPPVISPPIQYNLPVRRPTEPPPPYPGLIGICPRNSIPEFTPSATPLLTFPNGRPYPIWNVLDSRQLQPIAENPDTSHSSVNQRVATNGDSLNEDRIYHTSQQQPSVPYEHDKVIEV